MLEIMLFDWPCLLTMPSILNYAYMLFRLHMLELNTGKGRHVIWLWHTGNVMQCVWGMCSRER